MTSPGAAAATAGALLVGVISGVLGVAQPASAATAGPAAGTPTPVSATLILRTIPAIRHVRVVLDSRAFQTGRDGSVAIATTPGGHRIRILPPRSQPAGETVAFARWLDGLALPTRVITLSPGVNVEQAGFAVSHAITLRFTDTAGRPLPLSEVTRVSVASSLGARLTFPPTRPPRSLAVNRIVRDASGLVPVAIRYSVREVIIDGANVVYGGSQNFFVRRSGAWTVKVLLFPLRIEVRDALFGFPVGSAARLTLPDGSSRLVRLGAGHAAPAARLPRATYQLVAQGPGIGLSSPTALSKPHVARLLLLSWVDVASAAAFAALFLVGLPVLGGRVVRRRGKGLLAWREDSDATLVLEKVAAVPGVGAGRRDGVARPAAKSAAALPLGPWARWAARMVRSWRAP